MSKSVVIIGKGPSVLKSTKEFVDSFDEVAICNFPPMDGYEQHIGNRANYHFLNAHDPDPYSKERINSLGLVEMYNTSYASTEGPSDIFPDHPVYYDGSYGENMIPLFKEYYKFPPSTGIIAFDFFVKREKYTTIGLVGFDFFKVNEKGYYYGTEEVQESLKYLYTSDGSRPFNSSGIRVQENPHDSEKSEKYILTQSKKYKKEIKHL